MLDGVLAASLAIALWLASLVGASAAAAAIACVVAALAAVRVARGRWQATPMLATAAAIVTVALAVGNHAWPAGATAVVCACLLVSTLALLAWPVPSLPEPTGPHRVGYKVAELDGAQANSLDARRLQIHLWYPARVQRGAAPRPLLRNPEARAIAAGRRKVGVPAFLDGHLRLGRTSTIEGAAVAPGQYPLVVFNHGGAMWPAQNFSLMQELASRGYVCVAIGRARDTAGIAWQSGEITTLQPRRVNELVANAPARRALADYLLEQDGVQKRVRFDALRAYFEGGFSRVAVDWANDSLAAVERLSSEPPAGVEDVCAVIEFGTRAYVGMSLGGAAAVECCFLDSRARAGINLDGMNWNFARVDAEIPTAFLQVYGDPQVAASMLSKHASTRHPPLKNLSPATRMPNDFFYETPAGADRRADVIRLTVRGAGHMAFTDLALSVRGPARALLGMGNACGRDVNDLVNQLCAGFLDRYVNDCDSVAFEQALESPMVVRQAIA